MTGQPLETSPAAEPIEHPYPGLRPFRKDENGIFFGRERMIAEVIEHIAQRRFVLMHGASGSGKSSLVRAGVQPRLERLHRSEGVGWRSGTMRPGNAPMWHLATALAEAFRPEQSRDARAIRHVRFDLTQDHHALRRAVDRLGLHPDQRLLLIIDQFEEIFRFASETSAEEAAKFVGTLLDARDSGLDHVFIVLTMRSDHLGDCGRFPGLADAVNATQYLVPPMNDDELGQAIQWPARRAGGYVDDRLAEALITDTRFERDRLPLIQHVLSYLWLKSVEEGKQPLLTPELYRERAGGDPRVALSQHAQEAFDELVALDVRQARNAERVFRCITHTDAEGRAVRRPRTRTQIVEEAGVERASLERIIEAFAREGRSFLFGEEETEDEREPLVDISHEALIRHWQALANNRKDDAGRPLGWLAREVADRQTWTQLAAAARARAAGQAILLSEPEYMERKAWLDRLEPTNAWAVRYGEKGAPPDGDAHASGDDAGPALISDTEAALLGDTAPAPADGQTSTGAGDISQVHELLDASRQDIARRLEEHWAEYHRALRRRKQAYWVVACVLGLLGFAILTSVIAFYQWSKSTHQAEMLAKSASDLKKERDAAEQAREDAEAAKGEAEGAKAAAEADRERAEAGERQAEQALRDALHKDTLVRLQLAQDQRETGWTAAALRLALSALPDPADASDKRPFNDTVAAMVPGLVAALPDVLVIRGHRGPINGVALSPDGRLAATAGSDWTVRLWDAETGEQIRLFEGHGDSVTAVAFDPEGGRILTGSWDNTARLWDTETGDEIRLFEGHGEAVTAVAFDPECGRILTGSWDDSARLWDAETGAQIRLFEGHGGPVTAVALDPEGGRILTGSWDKTARLWDAETGAQIRLFEGHGGRVFAVAFDPEGGRILTGSDDGTARLLEAETGEQIHLFEGHGGRVTAVAFDPEGGRILTGSWDDTARLWDAETGAQIRLFEGHGGRVFAVAFDPEGGRILTGSDDGTARLLEAETGEQIHLFEGHGGPVTAVAFDPEGGRILTGSWDDTARLWDAETGAQIRLFEGHGEAVTAVAFDPEGGRILTGSDDDTARLWDAETGAQIRLFEGHGDSVTAVAFDPEGGRILTGSDDDTARLWDAETGAQIRLFEGHGDSVTAVAFDPEGGRILTGSDDGTARLWDAETGEQIRLFEGHGDSVTAVAFDPEGGRILTGSDNGTARLWDAETGKLELVLDGHWGSVVSVAFATGGRQIASASDDHTVRIWRLPEPDEPAWTQLVEVPDEVVFQVSMSPGGDGWVSGSSQGRLVGGSGELPYAIPNLREATFAVAQDLTGRWLATGSADGQVDLYDRETGRAVPAWYQLPGRVFALAFGAAGDQLLVGGGNDISGDSPRSRGSLRLLTVPDAEEWARREDSHTIYDARFAPDGRSVVTGSGDGVVAVLDAKDLSPVGRLGEDQAEDRGSSYAARFSPDGHRIAASFDDGVVRVWNVADGSLVQRFVAGQRGTAFLEWIDDGRLVTTAADQTLRYFAIDGAGPLDVVELPGQLFWPAFDGTDVLVPAEGGVYRVPQPQYRSWQELVALAEKRAGGRIANRQDLARIEILRALAGQ